MIVSSPLYATIWLHLHCMFSVIECRYVLYVHNKKNRQPNSQSPAFNLPRETVTLINGCECLMTSLLWDCLTDWLTCLFVVQIAKSTEIYRNLNDSLKQIEHQIEEYLSNPPTTDNQLATVLRQCQVGCRLIFGCNYLLIASWYTAPGGRIEIRDVESFLSSFNFLTIPSTTHFGVATVCGFYRSI